VIEDGQQSREEKHRNTEIKVIGVAMSPYKDGFFIFSRASTPPQRLRLPHETENLCPLSNANKRGIEGGEAQFQNKRRAR